MCGAVFPPAIYLGPNYGGGNEEDGDLLQKVPCMYSCNQCPNPAPGHHRPMPPMETPGYSQASLSQSLVQSLLLSPGSWCTNVLFVPSESLFPNPW